MMKRLAIVGLLTLAAGAGVGGCTSHLVPLRPVQKVEVWVPDAPAATQTAPAPMAASTAPAGTAPATTTAPVIATAPATQPGHMVTKTVDPNRTARFVYDANYDNVWKQAQDILTQTGFAIDRADYRLGVLTTRPLASSQILEFWKPQHAGFTNAMENTVNNQRRWVTLTILTVEGKPDFYEIGVQVLVERETNPTEGLNGPMFVEGSGFGHNVLTLRSDYAPPVADPKKEEQPIWNTVGHDPDLERKLLEALFKRI